MHLCSFMMVTHAQQQHEGVTVWILLRVFSTVMTVVHGQQGSGCGHTVLGPRSGTLASQNYPGTYPSDARCAWRLRVPAGRTLRLLFGDFDVESSPDCSTAGSLMLTAADGTTVLGPLCGRLDAADRNVTLSLGEVTVVFRSGPHRSGRGFLLSYGTDQHPDLISCLHRGSHFIPQHFSVYCPAGCRSVSGDIWGHSEQGYRDTSPLCKAAAHAGVTADSVGGRVSVSRGRSLTRYEAAFANGILSKMGSLSEKKLLFKKECNSELPASGGNGSSPPWEGTGGTRQRSSQNTDSSARFPPGQTEGTVLELAEKYIITGIITEGSEDSYVESYSLQFSKDRKTWKVYKDAPSKETKVFEAHADGHQRALNSLFPPVVARFVRLQPRGAWRGAGGVAGGGGLLHATLLGCPPPAAAGRLAPPPSGDTPPLTTATTRARATPPGPRSAGDPPPVRRNVSSTALPPPRHTSSSPPSSTTPPLTGGHRGVSGGPVVVRDTSLGSSQPMVVAVGVALGLVLCIGCLLAGVWWKRRKQAAHIKSYSLAKAGCQSFQGKGLPSCPPHSELISYPLERGGVHDSLPCPPLNDYAEPDMASVVSMATAAASGGQKVVSTFRPAPSPGEEEEGEEGGGYTTPFFPFSHYDSPAAVLPPPGLPDYAEPLPLPPEPEYATPFSEPPAPPEPPPPQGTAAAHGKHNNANTPQAHHHHHQGHPGGGASGAAPTSAHPPSYDCPAHRALSNGYCTPSVHSPAHSHAHSTASKPSHAHSRRGGGGGGGAQTRPPSAIYAEPQ